MTMTVLTVAAVRKDLADLIGKVQYRRERLIITKHDKPVAALAPVDDAALLEKIEDHLDLLEAMEAIEDYETNGGVGFERFKAELG